jgi:endo-1,4-beta-xylanase
MRRSPFASSGAWPASAAPRAQGAPTPLRRLAGLVPPPLARRSLGLAVLVIAACRGSAPTSPEASAVSGRLHARGLADRAAAKGLFFGVATNSGSLRNDSAYRARVLAEASSLTPEWEMKWNALRPTADRFDFDAADAIVAFASAHGMSVHGHTLVWGEALPGWFSATLTPANADSILAAHVGTVVGRYAGRVARWDVVNEAIDPEGGRADGLRDTPWLRLLGPGYVARAFRLAHAADPHAMLVLNDYGLEVDNPWAARRRAALLRLLRSLRADGVPVHAVGMQGHLEGRHLPQFQPRILTAFLDSVAALGLRVVVTEVDVDDRAFPGDVRTRDSLVARTYSAVLGPVLRHPAVVGVATWGVTDRWTWLSAFAPRGDGLPVRPLPFDGELQRKRVWDAIAAAIDARPGNCSPRRC